MTGGGSPPGTVHVIGAGLAGLAAALALGRARRAVVVHEAAGFAGGRCRSFHDARIGRRIDNGNHLLLSANRSALDYLGEIGSAGSLTAGEAAFQFLDLASGCTWSVRPGEGGVLRLLAPVRQVPGARVADALRLLRLAVADRRETVTRVLGAGPLMERFWRPLTLAVLNAEPEQASARLLRNVLREVLVDHPRGFVPLTVRDGLSETFVDPALAVLERRGVAVRFGRRLRAIERSGDRVSALRFPDEAVELGPADAVVLAVPPAAAGVLLPGLTVPAGSAAIVNAHFRLDAPGRLPGGAALLGLTGGSAQWVFVRGDMASVTVSAADALVDRPVAALLTELWRETAAALGMPPTPQPPGRIVKERRATFRQTPDAAVRRPPARTAWRNLVLAGDWTDTGLPATIEGAIRSGRTAAAILTAR